jgi:hypothetical protein
MVDERAGRDDDAPGAGHFAAALAFIALIHASLAFGGFAPAVDGLLPGPDSYMRLLRVTQLYETGNWFDVTIPRSNAPYGEALHWTRPFDVLLLAGALALEPVLGFQRALFWWGSATAPLLHLATALVLIWAAAPLFDRQRRFLLVIALMAELALWGHGILGRTDHHMMILLVFAASLGWTLRLMLRPVAVPGALLAGALAGLGLWLSIEFLVMLAAVFGALAVRWVQIGEAQARRNLWHAVGFTLVVALALVLERPAGLHLIDEYDRISAVHGLVGLVAAGFWAVIVGAERRGLATALPGGRVAAGVLGAAVAGAVMLVVYPKFYLGPEVDFDPRLRPIFLDLVAETRPLLPKDGYTLGRFLTYLGAALLALPYLAVRLWRARASEAMCAWLFLAFCLALYVPLALAMQRFVALAEILLALVVADLLGGIMDWSRRRPGLARRLAAQALAVPVVLFGTIAVGLFFMSVSPIEDIGSCDSGPLIAELNRPDGLGAEAETVLTRLSPGPAILYRTRHSVISTPYPRNAQGQLDAYRIYSAADFDEARRLVAERGIDLVVACNDRETYFRITVEPDMLDSHLRAGTPPDWLRPVELGEAAARLFRVYRVVPESP